MTAAVAAVDLGATSGRVMLGYVGRENLRLVPTARFRNDPVRTPDGLHWNILELYRALTEGLAAAIREEPELCGIGVDSWAVDYALLRRGRMLGTPFHYRDERTAGEAARVHALVPFEALYERNGLQLLSFTSLYQLAADRVGGWLGPADGMLTIPDLVNYWLTGEQTAEITNASTTGLLDVRSRRWDRALAETLGIPPGLLRPLVEPGETVGFLLPEVARSLAAAREIPVTAVGSHDTASAVAAVPATTENFAYISSGTWSLVGVELAAPVVSEESRRANFTNEGGVDGRIRFLKNVSGLWLLSESTRTWERDRGVAVDLPRLLAEAEALDRPPAIFNVADPAFIAPGDMPDRIASWYRAHGLAAPPTPAALVRAILESLAAAYALAVEDAGRLTGRRIDVVHIVGGGSQNTLLCQLTANRTGRPVVAGPVEATATGNVLVQARSHGIVSGSLEALRDLVARTARTTIYEPDHRAGRP
jgi:rhamnulokinase